MNSKEFQPGQSINADDAMNDMPTFAENARNNISEAQEYLEKHPQLKERLTNSLKLLEELSQMSDEELSDSRHEGFLNQVNKFNETTRNLTEARGIIDSIEQGKKTGKDIDDAYREAENKIHEAEDNMSEFGKYGTAITDNREGRATVEQIEKEGKTGADVDQAYQEAVDKIHSSEAYLAGNDESVNEDVTGYENADISATSGDENTGTQETGNMVNSQTPDVINLPDNHADTLRLPYDPNKIMPDMDKFDKAFEPVDKPFNELADMEKMNPEDMITMANWYAKQDLIRVEMAEALAKAEESPENIEDAKAFADVIKLLKDHPEFREDLEKAAEARKKNLEKTEESEFKKFCQEQLADKEFRSKFGGNDEEFFEWIKPMFEARKKAEAERGDKDIDKILADEQTKRAKEIGDMMSTGEDDVKPEKKGIFSKLRNFFSRSNRVKDGKANGVKRQNRRSLKQAAFAAMLGLTVFISLTSCGINNLSKKNATPAENAIVEEAGDSVDTEAQRQEQLLQKASEQSLNPEADVEDLNTITVTFEGENLEIDTTTDLWDGESDYYTEVGDEMGLKQGRYNLVSKLYDMQNAENMTNQEIVEQGLDNLYGRSSDTAESGQFALMAGQDFLMGDDKDGITSINEMNQVMNVAMSDEEARELMHGNAVDVISDLFDGQEVKLIKHEQGESHGSLYIVDVDGTLQYVWQDETNPAKEDFYAITSEKFNSNEAGGYKDRYLRAVGVIPEGASEEEARKIMEGYDIEISLKCGQVILITVDEGGTGLEVDTGTEGDRDTGTESDQDTGTESDQDTGTEGDRDTGTEGDRDTGTEGDRDTGTEGDRDTGTEGDRDTGTEGDVDTGTEGDIDTGTEGDIDTGTEGDIDTGTEGDIDTGTEGDTDDGKTDILPGNPDDGWTEQPVTPEDNTPTSEAGEENGYVNDNTPGSSSEDITIPVDNSEATEPTDATYSEDTSGWQGDTPSEEPGTQTIEEPSASEVNDTEANPESAADNNTAEENREAVNEAMDRFDNGQ